MYFKVHEVFAGELKMLNEILERFWRMMEMDGNELLILPLFLT